MTIEHLKEQLHTVMDDAISMNLYFVLQQQTGKDTSLVLRLADISSEPSRKGSVKDSSESILTRAFSSYVNDALINNDDLRLCKLSTDDEQSNAIYHYDYQTFPDELGLFKSFDPHDETQTIPIFNFSKDNLNNLFGYIISLGTMPSNILLFKKHYPIHLIKRGTVMLHSSSHRLEILSDNDILRMTPSAQLLRVNDEIYVTDIKMLERSMGFQQLIQKSAEQAVDAIDQLGILENIEVLKDTLEDAAFARKLAKVKRASPIFSSGISAEDIIRFTLSRPELRVKFKYTEDKTKIRLDTKKSKEAFIKLMTDTFLHSDLTNQYYEVSAKDRLTTKS